VARLVRADVLVEKSAHNNEPGRRDWREGDAVDRTSRESTDADPDPVVGGADAIEKTTYIADVHGAGVEDASGRGGPVTASVPAGGASPIAWVAAILAILALVAYATALFS